MPRMIAFLPKHTACSGVPGGPLCGGKGRGPSDYQAGDDGGVSEGFSGGDAGGRGSGEPEFGGSRLAGVSMASRG